MRILGLDWGYPVVPLVAFTPYVAALAVLAALALAALRRPWPAALTAIAAVALVAVVLPRAIADTDEEGRPFRVMTANMMLGEADAKALVSFVRDHEVDALAVQELTSSLARELHAAGLDEELPHSALGPAPLSAGGGVWTRHPAERIRRAPDSLAGPLPAVSVRAPGGGRIAFYSVHPPPPTGPPETDEWESDLATIPEAGEGDPVTVIAGDFNATLDHDALREVIGGGYRDAADAAGVGLKPTWPSGRRFPPQVTIDHVLVDERAGIAGADVLELPGSDHRAVVAEILLPPSDRAP